MSASLTYEGYQAVLAESADNTQHVLHEWQTKHGISPISAPELYLNVIVGVMNQDAQKASQVLAYARNGAPERELLWLSLEVQILAKMRKLKLAEHILKDALEKNGEDFDLLHAAARMPKTNQTAHERKYYLIRALRVCKTDEQRYKTYHQLFKATNKERNLDEALSYLDAMIALDPDNPKILVLKAQAFLKASRFEEARTIYRSLVEQGVLGEHILIGLEFHAGNVAGAYALLNKMLSSDQLAPEERKRILVIGSKVCVSRGDFARGCKMLDEALGIASSLSILQLYKVFAKHGINTDRYIETVSSAIASGMIPQHAIAGLLINPHEPLLEPAALITHPKMRIEVGDDGPRISTHSGALFNKWGSIGGIDAAAQRVGRGSGNA